MLARMWRKGNPLTLLVGMHTGAGTVENSMEIFQKLKLELPYDLGISHLYTFKKKKKPLIQIDISTPMFRAALFTIVKI